MSYGTGNCRAIEPAGAADSGSTAVIADDDEFFRIAISPLLARHLGFIQVIETASLDEALAVLAETSGITLALFDLRMPGMAGAGSVAAVRECYPTVKTAILSASMQRADVLTALSAGSHGYIPKTLGANDVVRAVAMILGGAIYVPPFIAEPPPPEVSPASPLKLSDVALTRRQCEVLNLIVQGRSNKEIARALDLGEGTVKVHVATLLRALGVANRSSAAVVGMRLLAGNASRGAVDIRDRAVA